MELASRLENHSVSEQKNAKLAAHNRETEVVGIGSQQFANLNMDKIYYRITTM